MTRKPAVSGQFYQADPSRLSASIKNLCPEPQAPKEKAIMALSPHAGFMYSGGVAGAVYSSITMPDTFLLIGPNHTGIGTMASIMAKGAWEVPNGSFNIDELLSERILRNSPLVTDDMQAHLYEHSIEVQLPFIAHFKKTAKIVPITVLNADLFELKAIGEAISRAIKSLDYPVTIVASSDMSHYVPEEVAAKKDRMAIDMMLSLDPEGLFKTVNKERISMCGVMPAVIALYASQGLGARRARLVKYTTSAEASGDYESVVGYAGITVSE